MSVSTHVLDTVLGRPAMGIAVRLFAEDELLAEAVTDTDGRARLAEGATAAGTHRLVFTTGPWFTEQPTEIGPHRLIFTTGPWFAEQGRETFFPEVVLTFGVFEPGERHHVPLLLAPFAYSTYRGS